MAEAAIGGEELQERPEHTDVRVRTPAVKQPNKKKHEEEVDVLNTAIRAKETSMKALNLRPDDSVQLELRTIRSEKDSIIGRRKKIDAELRSLNHAITKQMAELTKVQSSLQYKKEEKINAAITNLEYQLKMQNFRLSEEKKIVAEIDSLKRSKKALGKYIELKREIDGMRDRLNRMRQERDRLYKAVTAMKLREDEIKKHSQIGKAKADDIKREIDELYAKRKGLVSEFRSQEKEFQMFQKEQYQKKRGEYLRKKEEEQRAKQEQYIKDMEEYEASREPYEDEKLLINTLMSYLQRYLNNINGLAEQDSSSQPTDSTGILLDSARDLQAEGMYLLRKKSNEDDMYSVKPKTKKKNSRERKKSANKPLSHTPKTLDQFAQLGLSAPSVVTEVHQTLAQLEEKKKYYYSLPPPNRPRVHIDIVSSAPSASTADQGGTSDQDGSAGPPSVTESAISESIPSTPEVSLENHAPRFPRDESSPAGGETRHRKLSRDSGACELETSCDEQLTTDETQKYSENPLSQTPVETREVPNAVNGQPKMALFGYTDQNNSSVSLAAAAAATSSCVDASNCDDENDSETICNSTDNSNEADLGTIDEVESSPDSIAFPKLQLNSPGGSTDVAASFNSQELVLTEATDRDFTSESTS